MHPNIVKIYLVVGGITAFIWMISLLNVIQLGIVGYFLLVIFTVLLIISAFSKGPDSGSRPSTGREKQVEV